MRKRVLLFVSLAAVFGGGYLFKQALEMPLAQHQTTEGWIRFLSPQKRFSVDFPQDPSKETKQLEVRRVGKILPYEEYSSPLNGQTTYQVGYTDLPSKWTWLGKKVLLKGSLEVILQNEPGIELLSQGFSTYRKQPVLDFRLKKGEQEIKGRLLLSGRTLYKLSVSYPSDFASEQQHTLFLNSFDA